MVVLIVRMRHVKVTAGRAWSCRSASGTDNVPVRCDRSAG
jgi:hypothetical protein